MIQKTNKNIPRRNKYIFKKIYYILYCIKILNLNILLNIFKFYPIRFFLLLYIKKMIKIHCIYSMYIYIVWKLHPMIFLDT